MHKRLDGGGWPVGWGGHWNRWSIGGGHKGSEGNTILSHWGAGHTILLSRLLIGWRSICRGWLIGGGRGGDHHRSSRHAILLQRLGQRQAVLLSRNHRGCGDSVILEQGV